MTLGALKIKHRDVIIILSVQEIITEGMKAIANKDFSGNIVGNEMQKCVADIQKSYNENYSNFKEIIRRCL